MTIGRTVMKSGRFFLNIVVFPFTFRKETVRVSKTPGSLKYFALTTYSAALYLLPFYFTALSVLDNSLFYV